MSLRAERKNPLKHQEIISSLPLFAMTKQSYFSSPNEYICEYFSDGSLWIVSISWHKGFFLMIPLFLQIQFLELSPQGAPSNSQLFGDLGFVPLMLLQ